MTQRKRKVGRPQTEQSGFARAITGRIGQFTALVAAAGAFGLILIELGENYTAKIADYRRAATVGCAQLVNADIPRRVRFSEWQNVNIRLAGQNNCGTPLGLYVAFMPDTHDVRFRLEIPHDHFAECKSIDAAMKQPKCWYPKKPVALGKGPWFWNEVQLPPLRRLAEPRPGEQVTITWYVYDYDAPHGPAIGSATAKIEIYDDPEHVAVTH